jgi:ketosteroid isomerase-like protein
MTAQDAKTAAAGFMRAFSAGDFDAMRDLLAEDARALITNADGEMDVIEGRDEYLARIEAMDLPAARFKVDLTQAPVEVDSDRALVMVEIHAQKGDRTLHNFAAHLLRVADGQITEWVMVDAKPAESDRFWS